MLSILHRAKTARIERTEEEALTGLFPAPSMVGEFPEHVTDNNAEPTSPPSVRATAQPVAHRHGEVLESPAEQTERIGTDSTRAMINAYEMAARDVEQAGQSAVQIAADMKREAQQLAKELRASGKKISERLQEFAIVAKKVSTAMRGTHADTLHGVITTKLPEPDEEGSRDPSGDGNAAPTKTPESV
jgi:hypothetical protein